MADSRPLDAAAPLASAPTLAAVLNAAYAARHGHGFAYYRVTPTRETPESRGGNAQFGGAKGDYCTRNGALGVNRKTPWCKLLALWAVVQEEEAAAAACPADVILFIDSDAYVTQDGAALSVEYLLASTARLRPHQDVYEQPEPPGGYTRWEPPPGWRAPAAQFAFASNAPWWPAGPTTGTFAILGVGSPAGRATAAAVFAAWWDAPHPALPTAYATLKSVPMTYSWNEQHPYEQTPAMVAADAATAARLFDRATADAAAAVRANPLLAIARHMGVLDMETFRERPGQFVRHASSFNPGARIGLLREAASKLGLDAPALAARVASLRTVDFDAYAADARLRDGFAARTATLDVAALLADGDVRPRAGAGGGG
jgi:hypothetical protein